MELELTSAGDDQRSPRGPGISMVTRCWKLLRIFKALFMHHLRAGFALGWGKCCHSDCSCSFISAAKSIPGKAETDFLTYTQPHRQHQLQHTACVRKNDAQSWRLPIHSCFCTRVTNGQVPAPPLPTASILILKAPPRTRPLHTSSILLPSW